MKQGIESPKMSAFEAALCFSALSILVYLLLMLSGCGGGGVGGARSAVRGKAVVSVKWPARSVSGSRVIPEAANSIVIEVTSVATGGGQSSTDRWVLARPYGNQGGTSTYTKDMPVGTYALTANAYSDSSDTAPALAAGAGSLTVVGGQNSQATLTMGTTVASVGVVATANVVVGQTVNVAASAQDAQGNIILVGFDTVTWACSDPTVAVLGANGVSTTVQGLKAGQVTLTATFNEVEPALGQTPIASQPFWLGVTGLKVQSVSIAPSYPHVGVAQQLALKLYATDQDGQTITDPTKVDVDFTNGIPVTWSVDNTSVATIDPSTGVLTGVGNGIVNVTVTTASSVPTTTGNPVSATVIGAVSSAQYTAVVLDAPYSGSMPTGTSTTVVCGSGENDFESTNVALSWDLASGVATVLQTPAQGSGRSFAYGVFGSAIVGSGVVSGTEHALIWTDTSASPTDLQPAIYSGSRALAVSYGGAAGAYNIVGLATIGGYQHALLWTESGMIDLHPSIPGVNASVAHAVDGDVVVGNMGADNGTMYQPVVWSSGGSSPVSLGYSGYVYAMTTGVSGSVVCGYGATQNGEHALMWSSGVLTDLQPSLGFSSSVANAVYGTTVVGYGTYTDGTLHALLWSGSAASVIDLDQFTTGLTYKGSPINLTNYQATAINAYGDVIGQAQGPDATFYPIVWKNNSSRGITHPVARKTQSGRTG